jgi:hypothetical protein
VNEYHYKSPEVHAIYLVWPPSWNISRESIRFEEHITPDIVKITPGTAETDGWKLTVEEASAKHNTLGGKSFCRCKKDCVLVSKYSCVAVGKLCRDKYHGNDGHKVNCSNFISQEDKMHNYSTNKRKRKNDKRNEVGRKQKQK